MTLLKEDERRWLEIATTRNMFATEISTLTERLEAERALLKQAKALIHAVIDVHLADELVSNDLGDKLSLLEWVSDTFEHGRNCAANIPGNDEDCTCGLRWRIQVRTEQEMHAAWRKRAEEAEAELSLSRQKVEELERELAHEKSRHCIGGDIFEAGRNRLILNQATELEYLQRAEAAEQQAASLEQELREHLWASHGHLALYGDDGELQCSQCNPWDYKRAPLEWVRAAYRKATLERASSQMTAYDQVKRQCDEYAARAEQMRVALEAVKEALDEDDRPYKGYHRLRALMESKGHFVEDLGETRLIAAWISELLSLPRSNALKKHDAKVGAEVLEEAAKQWSAEAIKGSPSPGRISMNVPAWLRERAAALESECAEAGKDVGDGM